jgi:hypothetical protein
LVVSNGISIGTGTAGGTLSSESSTLKMLNDGTIGTPAAPLTTLNLDGGTLQLGVDGHNSLAGANLANIVATTVNSGTTTTINIASIANVTGSTTNVLISYNPSDTPVDPYSALSLGTVPAGYTATLVDDTGNDSVDLSITVSELQIPYITDISVSGITLNISATNGAASSQYVLLGTTNVALPLSQWVPILTNNFNSSGNLNLATNIINPAVPQQFYILLQ